MKKDSSRLSPAALRICDWRSKPCAPAVNRFALFNARLPGSRLRLQITVNSRYSGFPERAVPGKVLGLEMPVACLEDLIQGEHRVAADTTWRPTKRARDRLEFARPCESHPSVVSLIPVGLVPEVDEMRQRI